MLMMLQNQNHFFFFFDKNIEILLMINTNSTIYPNRDITESLDLDQQLED